MIAAMVAIALLALGACEASELMPIKAMAAAAPQSNAVVVIKDENREIPVSVAVSFDETNNETAGIPSHVGGNIQLKMDGSLYDVCYCSGDFELEKDGRTYDLWDNSIKDIVEAATGQTMDELCDYTLAMDGDEFNVNGWTRKTVFDILSYVYESTPVNGFDREGDFVRFTNNLGANFDLYTEVDIIYSPYLDACFDVSAYHSDFTDILASLH
jgi:hypothetical protein